MKTIYTFTLEGEDYPSIRFNNNLRLFAHILYETIYNYDGDDNIPLNINENIEYNHINDVSDYCSEGCQYKLDSDLYDDGYIYYEPFIIGESSLGLTISDETFSLKMIEESVQEVLRLLKLNYKVVINSVSYQTKDNRDERNRDNAIRLVFNKLGCRCNRRINLLNRIVRSSTSKRRVRNKGNRNFSIYGR